MAGESTKSGSGLVTIYAPAREGTPFSVSPGHKVLVPLLHSLGINAGTYHTHTHGMYYPENEKYAPHDKVISDEESAPAYLWAPSGVISKYTPIPNQPSQGDISTLDDTTGFLSELPVKPSGQR